VCENPIESLVPISTRNERAYLEGLPFRERVLRVRREDVINATRFHGVQKATRKIEHFAIAIGYAPRHEPDDLCSATGPTSFYAVPQGDEHLAMAHNIGADLGILEMGAALLERRFGPSGRLFEEVACHP